SCAPSALESVREDIAVGLALAGHEEIQDLILQREEVLEQALQVVARARAGLAKVLELVLQKLFAGVAVEDEHDDVEEKPRLLDIDLPVVGLTVDGGNIFFGLVSGAVFHLELETPGNDDLGAGRASHR